MTRRISLETRSRPFCLWSSTWALRQFFTEEFFAELFNFFLHFLNLVETYFIEELFIPSPDFSKYTHFAVRPLQWKRLWLQTLLCLPGTATPGHGDASKRRFHGTPWDQSPVSASSSLQGSLRSSVVLPDYLPWAGINRSSWDLKDSNDCCRSSPCRPW